MNVITYDASLSDKGKTYKICEEKLIEKILF